jgi:hypothetical protein
MTMSDRLDDIERTYAGREGNAGGFEIAASDYRWLTGELRRLRDQQAVQHTQTIEGISGQVAVMGVLGVVAGVIGTIVWSQNRCYRRYQRLCHRWFAGDPGAELGCLERAEDVCF